MARILSPSDYGLIGMIVVFVAISHSLIDSGFAAALIQKKDRTQTDLSTIFFFNIAISIFLYFLIFFLSPYIADFYDEPKLITLTKVVSINIVFLSLTIIQTTLYTINLNFRTQAKASLISVIISGFFGIYLAYSGYGVWSLVWQTLIKNALNCILLWLYSKWIPDLRFSRKSFLSLFSYGSKLLLAGLLYTIFENIYLFIIGKFFNAKELGYYVKARNIGNLPSASISGIILRVTFPVLSSIQDDQVQLLSGYNKIIRLTMFATFPLIILLAVESEPLISLLLTDKWEPAAIYLKLLCFVLIWFPINEININLLKVKALTYSVLKLAFLRIIVTVTLLIITLPFGIKMLVVGQIIASFLIFLVITFFTCNKFHINIKKQLKDVTHFIVVLLIIAYLTNFLNFLKIHNFSKLLLETIVFLGTYSLYSYYFFRLEFMEIVTITKKTFNL
jgi:O-antigen/teichoic acid export membrane protein